MINSTDNRILIVTALEIEQNAITASLHNLKEMVTSSGVVVEIGTHHELGEVMCAQLGAGNVTAAELTSGLIADLRPVGVVLVGVAGGIKDVAVGDVVIGTKIYYDEGGKETAEGLRLRPDAISLALKPIQRAYALARTHNRAEHTFEVFSGPIASGERVVASRSSPSAKLIQESFSDALAVEMEGWGVVKSAHDSGIGWIVIRGISDLLDDKSKSDAEGSQESAVQHAALIAYELAPLVFGVVDGRQEDPIAPTHAILRKKFEAFGLPESLLFPRDDLTDFLDRFLASDKTYALIEGTSGVGKTTTVLTWAMQKTSVPVIWLSGTQLRGGVTIKEVLAELPDQMPTQEPSGSQSSTPIILVVDAPDESGDAYGIGLQLRDIRADIASAAKILVLTRPYHGELIRQNIPKSLIFIAGTRRPEPEIAFELAVLTDDELARWVPAYLFEFDIDCEFSPEALKRCAVPIILRLFCESNRGMTLGVVSDLRQVITEYADDRVSKARGDREGIDVNWPSIQQSILEKQWISGGNAPVAYKDLVSEQISSDDLGALVGSGLLTTTPSPSAQPSLQFTFEIVADTLRFAWLLKKSGYSSPTSYVAAIMSTPPDSIDELRQIDTVLTFIAANQIVERDTVLTLTRSLGIKIDFVCARSMPFLLDRADNDSGTAIATAILETLEDYLDRYLPAHQQQLFSDRDGVANRPIHLHLNYSNDFEDVVMHIDRSESEHPITIRTDLKYPQKPFSFNGMSLDVTNFKESLGRRLSSLMARYEQSRSVTPRHPEAIAMQQIWQVIDHLLSRESIYLPASLKFERIGATLDSLGGSLNDIATADALANFTSTVRPTTDDRDSAIVRSQISELWEDMAGVKVPRELQKLREFLSARPTLVQDETAGVSQVFSSEGLHEYFQIIAMMIEQGYQPICEANFGSELLNVMPLYKMAPLRTISIVDGKNYRILLLPESMTDTQALGFIDVRTTNPEADISGDVEVAGFGDYDQGVADFFANEKLMVSEGFSAEMRGSIEELSKLKRPLWHIAQAMLSRDLEEAFGTPIKSVF